MKKMTRFLALALAVVTLTASLAACGDSTEGTSGDQKTPTEDNKEDNTPADQDAAGDEDNKGGDDATPAGDGFKIGYNYFGSGSYALLSLANNSKVVIEACGGEAVGMDDEFNVEKIIQDIENMISSGCDGLIIWLPAEPMIEQVANLCAEKKVPFVLNDKIPSDPAIKEKLMANEYFAGAIAPANAEYGTLLGQWAVDNGFKTCLISGPAAGDVTDTPRIEAFREVFEGAGGKIVDELHADSADAALPQCENALTANQDVDLVYGSGSDFGIAGCQALQNMQMDAKVVTSGLDTKALDLLKDGTYMQVVNGDFWVCGTFSAVILQNFLEGNPLKDAEGNPIWIDNVMPFSVPAEEYDLYKQCFLDNNCYSDEEIKSMIGITYDEFVEIVNSYSLDERLKANGYK